MTFCGWWQCWIVIKLSFLFESDDVRLFQENLFLDNARFCKFMHVDLVRPKWCYTVRLQLVQSIPILPFPASSLLVPVHLPCEWGHYYFCFTLVRYGLQFLTMNKVYYDCCTFRYELAYVLSLTVSFSNSCL